MKLDTYLLRLAVQTLRGQAGTCLMIGDSTTDMVSAKGAGIHRVGYANKPGIWAPGRSRCRRHHHVDGGDGGRVAAGT
jgi:phosphoglycolate phosphatase-like HAD superfamily hydrolase